MRRIALLVPLGSIALAACTTGPPPTPPAPDTIVRMDTVVVTREVDPPLPEGRQATLCLANGQSIDIRVSAAGDTLVGPRRVGLVELGPGVGFIGDYAGGDAWFVNDQPVTFNQRSYSKFGQPESRDCAGMRIVGDFQGVNLFAETSASEPFETLYVPVRAGVFQPYSAQVGRVRG